MKYLLFVFPLLFYVKISAQIKDSIKDPVINPALSIDVGARLASRAYFINDHNIVYQEDRRARKVIKADAASFSFSKNSDQRWMGRNKDGIFVNGNFVKTDTLGYQYLGLTNDGTFWRTKKAIFKNRIELQNFKASEFIPLKDSKGNHSNSGYYEYKNQVYYYDKKISDIDIHTVVFQERDRCYDKNGVYERGEKYLFEGQHLQYLSPYFYKMKNTLVTNEVFMSAIPESDVDSFMQLGEYYSKDKMHVYYRDRIFADADISSFVTIVNDFAKDKNHVYYQDDIIKDADVTSFVHLEGPYFKDKNHIYCRDKILPIDIADAGKLKIWSANRFNITNPFITDGKTIFLYDTLLDTSQLDIPSFGIVNKWDVYYDKNGVYSKEYNRQTKKYVLKKIPFNYSVAPNSNNVFVGDKTNEYIYYHDQAYNISFGFFENLTQEQIDLTRTGQKALVKINGSVQLKTIDNVYLGKAGNKIYWGNQETSADAETFEKIKDTYWYYKDKNNVYLYSLSEGLIPIKGIDPGTVRMFNDFLADKDYIYMNNYRIVKSKNVELLSVYEGSWPMCGVGNPVSSTHYLFKNAEGYWLALISNKNVNINKISASDPNLKKLLNIR